MCGQEAGEISCTEFLDAREYNHGYCYNGRQELPSTPYSSSAWYDKIQYRWVLISSSTMNSKSYILMIPTRSRDTEYNQLSDFIEPIPLHITTEELHYLREKEALSLPSHKVQQELWTAY